MASLFWRTPRVRWVYVGWVSSPAKCRLVKLFQHYCMKARFNEQFCENRILKVLRTTNSVYTL
uniref:Uncharacterized protein n=1 Tax=Anguilla anguilla TaxID=7936 RepID=A0A0E9VSY7_ANGAN